MDQTSRSHPISRSLQPVVSKGFKRKATEFGSRTNGGGSKAARANVYGDVHISDQAHAVVGDVVHHHHHHQSNVERSDLQQAKQSLIDSLVYQGMTQRINDIPVEHEGTFEWAFDDSTLHQWNNFRQWLSGDETFYWVSGKAGSGKSTLMKMMWSHAETTSLLRRNSNDAYILKHSFWLPGTPYQKNFEGLLSSLVNQSLSLSDALVDQLLIERKHLRIKKDITSWSLEELLQLLKHLLRVQADSSIVCLFLDGLDEIETPEDQEHVLDYLDDLATLREVKICASSRPEEPWTSQFSTRPRLRVQDFTRSDITRYARVKLQRAWSRGDSTRVTDQQLDHIVSEIGNRAEGVFLWARLAVTSLLRIGKGVSAGEISSRLNRLPKEIADLYRDMLRRRNEDPASVVEEAASYLKLLVDPWRWYQRVPPTLSLCMVLRRLYFNKTEGEIVTPTPDDILSESDQTRDRIRDICGGMIMLTGQYRFRKIAQVDVKEGVEEEVGKENGYQDAYLEFHHRNVLDFSTDHVDGRTFLENSKISEVDLMAACVDAECLYSGQEHDLIIRNAIKIISRFSSSCPAISDLDEAQAIHGLICRMNMPNPNPRMTVLADVSYIDESPDISQDSNLEGSTPPYYQPAIDIAGYSLERAIPSFFNLHLARYLAPIGADGRKLTKEYMNYLLSCSIRGDLPDVALQLLRAGADLHALHPRTIDYRRLRRPSDELSYHLFKPRDCYLHSFHSHEEEGLNPWRQVLAEHQAQSSYSMLCWPSSNQRLGSIRVRGHYEPLLMLIDIGRCCEIVKEDVNLRGSEDMTRYPYEITPKEYIGFAVNIPLREFIPIKVETLQFMVCENMEDDPNSMDIRRQQVLHFESWERRGSGEDEAGNLSFIMQEMRNLDMKEMPERFRSNARRLGVIYSDPEDDTAAQRPIPRFEPA